MNDSKKKEDQNTCCGESTCCSDQKCCGFDKKEIANFLRELAKYFEKK